MESSTSRQQSTAWLTMFFSHEICFGDEDRCSPSELIHVVGNHDSYHEFEALLAEAA